METPKGAVDFHPEHDPLKTETRLKGMETCDSIQMHVARSETALKTETRLKGMETLLAGSPHDDDRVEPLKTETRLKGMETGQRNIGPPAIDLALKTETRLKGMETKE